MSEGVVSLRQRWQRYCDHYSGSAKAIIWYNEDRTVRVILRPPFEKLRLEHRVLSCRPWRLLREVPVIASSCTATREQARQLIAQWREYCQEPITVKHPRRSRL